ncbi:MAG: ABC transporter ATP-binding protein [Bacteroidota bacterium]
MEQRPEAVNTLLEVRQLAVAFGKPSEPHEVIRNVSFRVEAGRTLSIVGESGSGKSVTSLAIMGLIRQAGGRATHGEILYSSPGETIAHDLLKSDEQYLRSIRGSRIAIIFQEPMSSLNPVHTCGQQVAEALMLHKGLSRKAAMAEVVDTFRKVRLPDPEKMVSRYPHELSGGQKQRVMIAMAICCKPDVLIADEPTTALDVTVQASILELLRELQAETGMGMVFITHDLGVVKHIADDVLVMYRGIPVEQGSVDEVFKNPQHAYTRGLLACRPSINLEKARLPVMSDFLNAAENPAELSTTSGKQKKREEKSPLRKAEDAVFSVRQLSVTYTGRKTSLFGPSSRFKAVDGISFDVFRGETLGLVGESGCGKTTLGRCMLGLVQAASGSICFEGSDLVSMGSKQVRDFRKQVQLVFQDPDSSLNPRLTVGQAILEPMQVHGLHGNDVNRKKKLHWLLERVGLRSEWQHRYPHQFSGGQRQRICIARALAVDPAFLICDESVSALDVSVQAQVLNLLNELKSDLGLTYVFISHDMSVVRYMSDRIMVMNKGRIEEIGEARQVCDEPVSTYTKSLIDAIPT